jgi:signal transduction histidine kinase
MVGVTLQFARDEATTEIRRPTDIAALVQSIVDDMADAGMPVTMQPAVSIVYDCRPDALKRAIRNLLDNAVKYGKAATVAIQTAPKTIEIVIDDPFYRLEESRSRDTGGVGLGLAIAQSIVQAHRGDLVLSNRPAGGLRAKISLPH